MRAVMSRSSSIAIFLSMITVLFSTTSADTPDCPYPCLPPPTSGGSINSYPPPPPSSTGGSGGGDLGGSFPPPPPGSYQPGVTPGYLAPPYSAYPSGSGPTPPPPNPVLPWFPWYYQHDNPVTGSTSAAAVSERSEIAAAGLLPLSLLLLVLLGVW